MESFVLKSIPPPEGGGALTRPRSFSDALRRRAEPSRALSRSKRELSVFGGISRPDFQTGEAPAACPPEPLPHPGLHQSSHDGRAHEERRADEGYGAQEALA